MTASSRSAVLPLPVHEVPGYGFIHTSDVRFGEPHGRHHPSCIRTVHDARLCGRANWSERGRNRCANQHDAIVNTSHIGLSLQRYEASVR